LNPEVESLEEILPTPGPEQPATSEAENLEAEVAEETRTGFGQRAISENNLQ
jgi:hypothetical protein